MTKNDLHHFALLYSELQKFCSSNENIDLEDLKKVFKVYTYNQGQYFVKEGDIPDKLGFVVQGLMKYYYIDTEGNEWIKHFSSENDFVSSYASFLRQTPSLYNIEAMEKTTILYISFPDYYERIENSKMWCSIARQYTEYIYFQKEKRESSFLKQNGSERYKSFLKEHKKVVNRIKEKDIASFIGITPVSLSRLKNKL